jgi:hypothetical protein
MVFGALLGYSFSKACLTEFGALRRWMKRCCPLDLERGFSEGVFDIVGVSWRMGKGLH